MMSGMEDQQDGMDTNMEHDLIHAVKNNNESEVTRLINAGGADVNQTEGESGKTALFYANKNHNVSMVCELIDAGSDFSISEIDAKGVLHNAVRNGKDELVRKLIHAGIAVDEVDGEGKNALFEAVCCSNETIVHLLVEEGKAFVNARDLNGRTPLFYAITKSTNISIYLIEKGANVKVKDFNNRSVLSFFIEYCMMNEENVPLASLMSAKSEEFNMLKEPNKQFKHYIKTILGIVLCKLPLMCAFEGNIPPPLYIAKIWNNFSSALTVARTYFEKQGNTDKMSSIDSILKIFEDKGAFGGKCSELIKLLVDVGGNANFADADGNTALHYVTHLPFLGVSNEVTMSVLTQLARYGLSLNARNNQSQTPLLSCLTGSLEKLEERDKSPAMKTLVQVCTFLVNNGSNIAEMTKSGESVFHLIIKLFQQGLQIRDETARKNVIDEALKLLELFSSDRMIKGNTVNKRDFHLNSPLHYWASLAPSPNYSSSESFRLFSDTLEKILEHLLNLGTILNARNEYEETPLHLCKTWAAVKLLLDNKANPNDVDSSGSQPLLVAAKKNLGINRDHLYTDVSEDPKTFWRTAVQLGLDPWTVNKHGECVFTLLVKSEALISAEALVNVSCEKSNAHVASKLSNAYIKINDDYSKSALFHAVCQCKNECIVRTLTDAGADVNTTDNEGKTALFHAVQQSNNEIVVRALIDAGADVNTTDNEGKTALFHAVQQSNNEIVVRALIDAGADVNTIDKMGKTVLFYAVQQSNNENVVCALIDAGTDVNTIDKVGKTALFYAVQQSNNENVVRVLIDAGADMNRTDDEGKTALFHAVQQSNNESVVRVLIDAGADVNKREKFDSKPPLMYNQNERLIQTLIDAGANVNKRERFDSKTPLIYALEKINQTSMIQTLIDSGVDTNTTDDELKTAFFYAVQQSNNESVVRVLIDAGADAIKRERFDSKIPLMYDLEKRSQKSMIQTLIDVKAVNTIGIMGKTALFYAVQQSNNESVVRALIDAGADVNTIDKVGKTALFYAVQQSKNESVVHLLIDAGADVNRTDNEGKIALFYAVQQRNNENVVCQLTGTVSTRDIYGRTAHFYINVKAPEVLRCLVQGGGNRYLKLKDNCNVDILAFLIDKWVSDSEKSSSRVEEIFDVLASQGLKRERFAQAIVNTLFLKAIFVFKRKYDKFYFDANEDKNLLHLAKLYVDKYYTGNEGLGGEMKMKSIMTALKNGFPNISETLELLIEMGADPDSADSHGNTALHYTTRLPLSNVPQKTVLDLCHQLETFGVQMNKRNHQDQSALLFCLSGDICHLKDERLLAAIKTQVEVCKFLVKCGSSIEDTSKSGESVFHLMIKIFNRCLSVRDEERRDVLLEAIKLLQLFPPRKVANGNTVNKPDAHLNSPLHLWASLALSSQKYTDIITSENHTFKKFLEIILQYLLECGANVNARNQYDQTPLHLCKTWSAVKLLIDAGANSNVVDSSGSLPLLAAVKEKNFGRNLDRLYPDVSEEPKTFWKTAVQLGLDPWTSDKDDESVLSILVESEAFPLAKSLVDVACEDNSTKSESITISLLNALCKDQSIRTNWKANLVHDILKSSKCGSTPLSKPLLYCCKNVMKTGVRDVKKWDKTDCAVAVSPIEGESYDDDDHAPLPKRRTDESDGKSEAQAGLYQVPVTVHCEIIKLLRWYGAGGEVCKEIAQEYSQLSDLLLKPLTDDQLQEFIPWTPVSKKYEDKLAKVARRQELVMVEQIWYHRDHIGSGSFGLIFAGINEKDGREVAIKRIERLRLRRPEEKREIQNLITLADCQQVVRYVSFFEDQHFCYVVLELMEGNLEEYLNECTIDATEATRLCKDVIMGLKFLHKQDILHRDLKPRNILYKTHPKVCVKIADFGLSRRIDSTTTTVYGTNAGTRCWIAPEILKSPKDHSKSSDIFSCGLLLHYILSGQKHPFCPADCANKSEIQVTHETEDNLMKGKMEGWDNSLSPEASHLVRKMIERTAKNRPSAEEAIDHPLFWTKEKKINLLKAFGNQPAFEYPCAVKAMVLTAVETG